MAIESRQTDDGIDLPADFAAHAATLLDLETPPATFEECWTAMREQYSEADLAVGFDDLYNPEPTRHEVHVNERVQYTYCALDALMGAVMEPQDPVTLRSIDPVSGTPVTVTVGDDAVDVSPGTAILCFGLDLTEADVEAAGSLAAWSLQDDKDEIRESVCQYTNAFENEATYEQWAAQTDSLTAPLPPEDVVPLVRQLPSEGSDH